MRLGSGADFEMAPGGVHGLTTPYTATATSPPTRKASLSLNVPAMMPPSPPTNNVF